MLEIRSFANSPVRGEGSLNKRLANRLVDRPLRHERLREHHTANNVMAVT